ncbi:lipase family protein [Corynebacterium sp. NPDC060344]|uniref:lipase family protein n=1 Tax=Corynebacterium sp. NPDC060344 TaxID=3347101 RepID=UPI0036636931
MIRLRRTVLALGTSAALVLAAAPAAHALGPFPEIPARAAGAGALVDQGPFEIAGGNDAWNADAQRFSYRSTDSQGRATVDSAIRVTPRTPWTGPGPRPVVLIAPGTQGMGVKCDPSQAPAAGIGFFGTPPDASLSYEAIFMKDHVDRGASVIMIDHHRSLDDGTSQYVDNIASGQSLLDAGVAARELGDATDAPTAIYGYSQGGSAAGWAAEHEMTYAPELNIVAAAAGAPPSDLNAVLDSVDGGLLMGVLAYAANGVLSKDPELRDEIYNDILNDRGRQWLDANNEACVVGTILNSGFTDTRTLTVDGSSLKEVLARFPEITAELERQKLGKGTPAVPTMLYSSVGDDVIPIGQVRELRDTWQAKGAPLTYVEDQTPMIPGQIAVGHGPALLANVVQVVDFLWERLAPAHPGSPIPGVPGSLTPQLPEVPGMPGMPELPGSPSAPGAPGTPEAPAAPGAPAAPAAPAQALPALPQQATIPGLPQLQGFGLG